MFLVLKHSMYLLKYVALIVSVLIYSSSVYAVQCGEPAPLSADRQFAELGVPDLTKTEVKSLNKFLSRFRKRLRGERIVETCVGRGGAFTREKQIFSEDLDVDEGLNDGYHFDSQLVERSEGLVRSPRFFLQVDGRLSYGETDSSRLYMPVKILAMSKNELRYLRLFRVNRRGGGSSIFEVYHSIVWQGKNVLFDTTTYVNGFFFSEVNAKLR